MSYFQLLPKELDILIFQELDEYADMKNFIKAFDLEDLFSNGNTWKIIFNNKFIGIELTLITGINYSSKDYIEYLITYIKLTQAYTEAKSMIGKVMSRFDHNLQETYPEVSRSEVTKEMLEDLNYSEDYSYITNRVLIYRLIQMGEDIDLSSITDDIVEVGRFYNGIKSTLIISFDSFILNFSYPTLMNNATSINIEISEIQAIEYLMYNLYNLSKVNY